MKRFIHLVVLALMLLPTAVKAQSDSEFTKEQLAVRTDLFNFLKVEGYMPEIDSDGDIKFKRQGSTYYFMVSKTDSNPMYVILTRLFNLPEDYSTQTLVLATQELNKYKGVKVMVGDEYFSIRAELFVKDAEPVKVAFYKLCSIMDSVAEDVLDECKKVSPVTSSNASNAPFTITSIEVANVDKSGTIITDYGAKIYDFRTKYLKPRITINPKTSSGTYTVYVKLYKDGVLQRNTSTSPSGYTFSDNITINGSSQQKIGLSGWGNDTAGTWDMGTYRYEVWYNGNCLSSKTFTVY